MNEIIIIGLILSLIYSEITEISPGGMIVPAYFALYINDPKRILLTIIISFLCLYIVKIISNYTILYGKRKFVVYVITGILLKYLLAYYFYDNLFMFYDLKITIGYLIPGILAKDFEKQGSIKTILSLFIVVFMIKLVQISFWG